MGSGGEGPLEDSSGGVRRRPVGGSTIPEGATEDDSRRNSAPDYQIYVSRPAFTVPQLRHDMCYQPKPEQGLASTATNYLKSCVRCSPGSIWAALLLRVPVLAWMPHYAVRRDLVPDIIAGLTVAVMHLPQGMAYAMLAEVPPIIGLYTAFFPVLAYAIFGTSRHVSVGTFAVACLMTGKVVGELSTPDLEVGSTSAMPNIEAITLLDPNNGTSSSSTVNFLQGVVNGLETRTLYDTPLTSPPDAGSNTSDPVQELMGTAAAVGGVRYSPIQVAVAVSFAVGVWQVLFGLLQVGQVCVFLSDMLISGFTTGAACHVLSSQVKHILGVKVPRYSGPFRLIYTYSDIFKSLPDINVIALVISVVCITILACNNELIKPRVKKLTNVPVPIEMIVVVLGTVLSYFTNLETAKNIEVVGEIPTGLPTLEVPDQRLLGPVMLDSFVLAIVTYAISFSMAKIFSKRHGYTVDATQELYAGGLSNIFGSLFSSVPSAVSLSRSLIQESVGGKTQVTSFVSCAAILLILLFVGPIFEALPTCVLASIILVALKGMFLQVEDFLKMWKQSRVDSLLWMVTFLVTVLVDIDYGLACGVLMSLGLLLQRNSKPTVTSVGWLPGTDIYVDIDTYQSAVALPGARLCRVYGALHFANCDSFRAELARATGLDITAMVAAKLKSEKSSKSAPIVAVDEGLGHTYHQKQEGLPPAAREKELLEMDASTDNTQQNQPVIVIENKSHNLTREVIREAIVNAFKKKNSYTCEVEGDACRSTSTGHQNPGFVPDEPDTKSTPSKMNPLTLLKRGSRATAAKNSPQPDVFLVVVCLAGVGWVDVAAAKQLVNLFADYSSAGITMTLTAVNDPVMQVLRKVGAFTRMPENRFFHSIHDAVTFLMPSDAVQQYTKAPVIGPLHTTHDARPAVVLSHTIAAVQPNTAAAPQHTTATLPHSAHTTATSHTAPQHTLRSTKTRLPTDARKDESSSRKKTSHEQTIKVEMNPNKTEVVSSRI